MIKAGADLEKQNAEGQTALMLAVLNWQKQECSSSHPHVIVKVHESDLIGTDYEGVVFDPWRSHVGINVVHYGDTRNETTNKKETTQIHEIGKIIESNQDGGSGSSDGVVGGLGEDRL